MVECPDYSKRLNSPDGAGGEGAVSRRDRRGYITAYWAIASRRESGIFA